ncbi:MAG: YaaR family protein [Treponema sp.]|nr:YaaR family protein [Treponema sp.]
MSSTVDPLSSSIYFSATAQASKQTQKEAEKSKTSKTTKSAFSSMVQKTQEMESLAASGLPPEIAGLDTESALVFLKDQIDMAADELEDNMNAASFAKFRKSVGQLLRYVEKNNYQVAQIRRLKRKVIISRKPYLEEVRDMDPYYQIRVVDDKLNQLASMILQNHAEKLQMLSKLDEIKGMLVDFFAV